MFKKISTLFALICVLSSCIGNQEQAENQIIQSKTILTLGDSLTAGYGLDINESYPNQLESTLAGNGYDVSVINGGISGDTSGDLLSRAGEYLEQNSDIVIIVIGGNDGLRGLPVVDMQENIQSTIDLYKGEDVEIILGGMDILPIHGFGYRSDFIDVYKNISENNPEIYFLKSFLSGVAARTEFNQSDNIHPNALGYEIISGNIYDFLIKNKLVEK